MLEHQADFDALWDAIHSLDNRPDHLSAGELTAMYTELDKAVGYLRAVATDVLAESVEAGDRDDAAS